MTLRSTYPFVSLLLCVGLSWNAAVEADAAGCGVERDVGTGALDEWAWRRLNAIYEDVGEERYEKAFQDLQKMLEGADRDAYLQAILNQAMAQVEWVRGNYESSLRFFEKAVELDTLPDDTHFKLQYQIAQLYYMQDRPDEALARLALWFCAAPASAVTASAYVLEAAIHAQREDHAGAIRAISRAIAMDENPQEDWYLLKLAAHYQLEQYPQAAATLEKLAELWPGNRIYWLELSQVYERLGRDTRALAVLALAHRRGLLSEEVDILYLSSLYQRAGLPFKAAEILESGIRGGVVAGTGSHWAQAADAWYAAAEPERALAAYGEAGRASVDGDFDLRRAYILIELERWPAAVEALDQALGKGGLDDRRAGEAYLLRGLARYSLDRSEEAAADWEQAGRYETSRDAAEQWLNHMREELGRQTS